MKYQPQNAVKMTVSERQGSSQPILGGMGDFKVFVFSRLWKMLLE